MSATPATRTTPRRKSRRRGWTVTLTIDGRDRGHWAGVQAVEPWTAVYYVLRYGHYADAGTGTGAARSLADVEGLTVTVKPDPVPPEVQP